ncbi:hypothetical protein LUZ63_008151 [Rhynchospora breviuscula]|uniref:Uncharacterized protein n=1 Tax=Rhynchospora breviuscula TaxID=2022672 RepID=A0A9Q0CT09_9POAL|nr:hypothetical protein LUZ63_008151 [Rhynchospora breviuscula]
MLQNNFTRSIPNKLFESKTLLELSLSSNGLTCQIPASIGRLSGLQRLQLDNNLFTGSIPPLIGKLKNLTILSLHGNRLSGEIPSELFDCMSLVALYLGSNKLTGSIPSSISLLTQLNNLVLSNNQLTGEIPDSICNGYSAVVNYPYSEFYQHYGVLDISYNNLIGQIPSDMRKCMVLKKLRLQVKGKRVGPDFKGPDLAGLVEGPGRTGPISNKLFESKTLLELSLSSNGLTCQIPASIGRLSGLQRFQLDNNLFTGSIPPLIGKLKNLTILSLYGNRLSGEISYDLFDCMTLVALYLGSNELTGSIPSSISLLTQLNNLVLSNNRLTGEIPDSICNGYSAIANYPYLELYQHYGVLDISYNSLIGHIPSGMRKCMVLKELRLQGNMLTGALPSELFELANLTYIDLSFNSLTGELQLFPFKKLQGTIEETFKKCRNLTDLILSGNKLSREIPGYLSELPLDTLEMLQNNFTGPIPNKLFKSKTLLELSLSSNGLTCQISASIGRLSCLQRLKLDNNLFTGSIPSLIEEKAKEIKEKLKKFTFEALDISPLAFSLAISVRTPCFTLCCRPRAEPCDVLAHIAPVPPSFHDSPTKFNQAHPLQSEANF